MATFLFDGSRSYGDNEGGVYQWGQQWGNDEVHFRDILDENDGFLAVIFADLPRDHILELYWSSERARPMVEPFVRGFVWAELPNEILKMIAEQCERKALLSLSYTSKYVHSATKRPPSLRPCPQ